MVGTWRYWCSRRVNILFSLPRAAADMLTNSAPIFHKCTGEKYVGIIVNPYLSFPYISRDPLFII